jgi:hypothetical protein
MSNKKQQYMLYKTTDGQEFFNKEFADQHQEKIDNNRYVTIINRVLTTVKKS